MKRVALLMIGGLVVAGGLLLSGFLGRTQATPLTVQDLLYEKVDVDGDGKYTPGDSMFVQTQIEIGPELLEEALKHARRNPDGGIDLSPFLSKLGTHEGKVTQFINGRLVTKPLN